MGAVLSGDRAAILEARFLLDKEQTCAGYMAISSDPQSFSPLLPDPHPRKA
jgi:hypothetical protein